MSVFVHPTRGPLHLGRPRVSPRTNKTMAKAFVLHDYLATLPDPPESFDNTHGITDWKMMLNDVEGDCTCATCGHLITAWTGGVIVPDSAVQTAYEGACGFNPNDPFTDQGGVITNVLDYFRTTGIGGHKITDHAEVNLTQFRIEQAVSTFGGLDMGILLPKSAQDQVGDLWDIINFDVTGLASPGSWGGHSVPIVKYDPTGLWVVTWGKLQKASWRWLECYADEGQACISPDYKSSNTELVGALQQVGS